MKKIALALLVFTSSSSIMSCIAYGSETPQASDTLILSDLTSIFNDDTVTNQTIIDLSNHPRKQRRMESDENYRNYKNTRNKKIAAWHSIATLHRQKECFHHLFKDGNGMEDNRIFDIITTSLIDVDFEALYSKFESTSLEITTTNQFLAATLIMFASTEDSVIQGNAATAVKQFLGNKGKAAKVKSFDELSTYKSFSDLVEQPNDFDLFNMLDKVLFHKVDMNAFKKMVNDEINEQRHFKLEYRRTNIIQGDGFSNSKGPSSTPMMLNW